MVDHLHAPPCAILPLENHPADVPVQQHHRGVGGKDNAHQLLLNARLDGGGRGSAVFRQFSELLRIS
jgi:hypothetical protein